VREIWQEPLFDAPLLGLSSVPAGEVVLASRALVGEEPTLNRQYFNAAAGEEDPEEALPLWLACLEAGDSMAHFGLGYTLYELGRHQEAYRHLRHYTEIAPHGAWNWSWYGKAAEVVGQKDEAIAAYERAVELEAEGEEETEATERLKELIGFEGMASLRDRLNEQTGGEVGLYSTTEHYSSGPSAKVLRYWQYDRHAELHCPRGDWTGTGEEAVTNLWDELFDVCCPVCDKMLLVVGYPTLEETREEAARGNEEAQRELSRFEDPEAGEE
jgi:tetratricopeptide (TPR) repeat protein